MKKMIIALLLLLSVNCWSACQSVNAIVGTFGGYTYKSEESGNTSCANRECDYNCTECRDEYYSGGFVYAGIVKTEISCTGFDAGCGTPARWCSYRSGNCRATVRCDRTCEVDSLKGCPNGYIWNSDSCKCVGKPNEADSTFTVCTEDVRNGNVYSSIYSVTCHYNNGTATQCCGVSPNSISGEGYKSVCPMVRQERGTCEQNGVPNGPSPPSNGTVPFLPTAQCYAVVGYTCYMRDYASGRTYSCECDGSCTNANMGQVTGLRCRNPYPQPTQSSSSESGGGSSSPSSSDSGGGSSSPSSSDSGSSSPSSSPSSGTSGDYTEQLNQLIANTLGIMDNTQEISQWTQQTMNNTTDIKNSMTEIGVDISNVRNNTQQTAQNTSSIDDKLSITNSLLNDIKNKEWNPTINVNPPEVNVNVAGDTNIVNVDTSKAPAEILETMRTAFEGEGSDSDTNGTGAIIDGFMRAAESLVGDTTEYKKVGDSVGQAIDGLYDKGFGAIRDTLGQSAIADSMGAWAEKLTDNGVISGSGSDQCPSVLTRTWNIQFPFGLTNVPVTVGPLGVYLCNEVAGMGITFWALCRVILRAIVAIGCMMWLYKSVVGIDGGSNEED